METIKNYAEEIIENLGGIDDVAYMPQDEFIETVSNTCRYEDCDRLLSLADDGRRHYRVDVDAGTLPKYSWPQCPREYVACLAEAIVCECVLAQIRHEVKNR